MAVRQRITPFLGFDGRAAEAAELCVSIFEGSRILDVTHCGEAGPGPEGSVRSARCGTS